MCTELLINYPNYCKSFGQKPSTPMAVVSLYIHYIIYGKLSTQEPVYGKMLAPEIM